MDARASPPALRDSISETGHGATGGGATSGSRAVSGVRGKVWQRPVNDATGVHWWDGRVQ